MARQDYKNYEIATSTYKLGRAGKRVVFVTNGVTRLRGFRDIFEARNFIDNCLKHDQTRNKAPGRIVASVGLSESRR